MYLKAPGPVGRHARPWDRRLLGDAGDRARLDLLVIAPPLDLDLGLVCLHIRLASDHCTIRGAHFAEVPLVTWVHDLRTPIRAATIKMEDTLRIVRRSCGLVVRAILLLVPSTRKSRR